MVQQARIAPAFSASLILVAALILHPHTAVADSIIYSQPAVSPVNQMSGIAVGSGVMPAIETFTLTEAAMVSAIQWQGSYFVEGLNPTLFPTPDAIAFSVVLDSCFTASCNSGLILYASNIPIADTDETLVSDQPNTLLNGVVDVGLANYSEQVTFATPILMGPGIYELYTTALLPLDSPEIWRWDAGTNGDGKSGLANETTVVPFDLALSVIGTESSTAPPVPEPPSLIFMGLGTFAFAARSAWRRLTVSR
jgi:hypothetical protein